MTEPFCIIGHITEHGTIESRSLSIEETAHHDHQTFWPGETKKLFRFYPVFWKIHQSLLSTEPLTADDEAAVLTFVESLAERPRWTYAKAVPT